MSDEKELLVELPDSERIRPGDLVERRVGFEPVRSEYRREYKVKKGKAGNLIVKYQIGTSWDTEDLPPKEFHRRWRRVTASPAVRFVGLFTAKMREKSAQKRPALIKEAIKLAVEAQMRFDPTDFETFRIWFGEDEYSIVVESGNASAITALEKYMKREPFWYVNPRTFQKTRLYEGVHFTWNGVSVKLTSFQDKNNLIACHQSWDEETRRTKTHRVFRISRADLDQHNSLMKGFREILSKRSSHDAE